MPSGPLPGGYVEPGESPRAAAKREVLEELGLHLEPGPLLAVDWAPHEEEGDKILFIFSGGLLTAERQRALVYTDGEVSDSIFVHADELLQYTIPRLAKRLAATVEAATTERSVYLEHGQLAVA